MRRLYIVAPGTVVDQTVIDAAAAQTCSEIIVGIPTRLSQLAATFPQVYVEPDDPEAAPVALAVTQLRNTFQTARTAAQINNSLDALTILMRQLFSRLR